MMAAILASVGVLICVGVPSANKAPQLASHGPVPGGLCGLNSLYMLLRSKGLTVDYYSCMATLRVSEEGVSLQTLREAAESYGLNVSVWKCDYQHLIDQQTPFIVHFRPAGEAPKGHFSLVIDVNRDRVILIDGTTGARLAYTRAAFLSLWTGYILAPKQRDGLLPILVILTALNAVLIMLPVARVTLGSYKKSSVLTTVLICILSSAARGDQPRQVIVTPVDCSDADFCRRAGEDAPNCLYIFLKYWGKEADWPRVAKVLRQRNGQISLEDMRQAAQIFGLKARIEQWRPSELNHYAHPAIIYMESPNSSGGQFSLVLSDRNPGRYWLLDGHYARVSELGAEEFRRLWTGYVLIPATDEINWPLGTMALLLVGLIYGVGRSRFGCRA